MCCLIKLPDRSHDIRHLRRWLKKLLLKAQSLLMKFRANTNFAHFQVFPIHANSLVDQQKTTPFKRHFCPSGASSLLTIDEISLTNVR